MLKPSELSPATAGLVTELLPKYLDQDAYRIVNGAIPETTKVCVIDATIHLTAAHARLSDPGTQIRS